LKRKTERGLFSSQRESSSDQFQNGLGGGTGRGEKQTEPQASLVMRRIPEEKERKGGDGGIAG